MVSDADERRGASKNMANFWRLYSYEWKKIWYSKLTKVTVSIFFPLCIFAVTLGGISVYLTDRSGMTRNRYSYLFHLQEESKELSGSVLDQQLITGMQQAFRIWKNNPNDETREQFQKYRLVYNYMFNISPNMDVTMFVTENALYQYRTEALKDLWRVQQLTEDEIAYWMERENNITTPFPFGYAIGWGLVIEQTSIINIVVLLVIVICLSGVFSQEKELGTEQFIYSSKLGKKQLYIIKIFAGISFSAAISISFYLLSALLLLLLYGAAGFQFPIQLIYPYCSWPVSVGQGAFLYFLLYFVATLLYAMVTMFLSLLFQKRGAIFAFCIGYFGILNFIGLRNDKMVSPYLYLDPPTLIISWNINNDRLLNLFGKYLTFFQFAPIVYLLLIFLLLFTGRFLYLRKQIGK